mgnify:CR=1 FL=1
MIVKTGVPASIGIAIGRVHLLKEERIYIEKKDIPKEKTKSEIKRFKEAITKVEKDLDKLKEKVLNVLGHQHAKLIEVHHLILKDPLITKDVPLLIVEKGITAESALSEVMEKTGRDFNKIKDDFFHERKNDIFDVCKKIISHLIRKKIVSLKNLSEPVILVAHNLYPSDTIQIKESGKVLAFCTDMGNKSSHTAIFAQSVGIPAVVGLSDITAQINDGENIIVDGEKGIVILSPDEDTLREYAEKRKSLLQEERFFRGLKKLPTATRDGKRISLMVNVDVTDSVKVIKDISPDGIGLFRTEMLYMNRDEFPSVEEQTAIYYKFLKNLPNSPVIIRTADIGGDRAPQFVMREFEDERNPFMGLRGIRFFLKHPELLKNQISAIYRANVHGNAKIMIPMVSNMEEINAFKEIALECRNEIAATKIKSNLDVEFGIMVEIPSAALVLDSILGEIDFVSIGTNDLVQYMLAVDRVNHGVSELYDHYHPAVLRIINLIVQTAHKKGKKVSVCGEMATEPLAAALLVGLGVDILSVPVKMYLRLKYVLRSIGFEEMVQVAQNALGLVRSDDIKALLKDHVIY